MADQVNQATGDQGQNQSLGWRAGLPDDLKNNETLSTYKTVGDLGKSHVEALGKVKKYEGEIGDLNKKLGESIPPEDSKEYEFPQDKEFQLAPATVEGMQKAFHANGLNKSQAKGMADWTHLFVKNLVKNYNDGIKKEINEAGEKLKVELGDKYDESVELATRLWNKHMGQDQDFDKMFSRETNGNRHQMIRFLLKIAKLTGEDISLAGEHQRGKPKTGSDAWFPNSPASPTGK